MTTLREFGFNDICDYFEALRNEAIEQRFRQRRIAHENRRKYKQTYLGEYTK